MQGLRIQREDVLAAAAVQSRVTAVNVNSHRGIAHCREVGGKDLAVRPGPLRRWCEQPLQGDLVLATLLQIRVHARGRIPAHRAGGQEVRHIVRAELHGLGALLPVRPLNGERRGVAVALEVHTVALDTQRVIHLQRFMLPLIRRLEGILLTRVVDVGLEAHRLAVLQVVGLEVLDVHAEGGQPRAVEHRAVAEGIEVGDRGVAELRLLGIRPCHHDDLALVVEHLARRHRDENAHKRQVEDQVRSLAQVALLRGHGPCPGAVVFLIDLVDVPALKLLAQGFLHVLHRFIDGSGVVVGHAVQALRRWRRGGTQGFVVVDTARQDAADQGDKQQYVDRHEPGGPEDVEKL